MPPLPHESGRTGSGGDASRRRVAVVLNSAAGTSVQTDRLREAFANSGLDPVLIPLQSGSLPERAARAAAMDVWAVVAAGGDGTVACVAQALVHSTKPLGIIPLGTMNLLAKDLDLPIGDLAAAVDVVAHGTTRSIDAAEVNGHLYLCASMLGLPARLARHREGARHGRQLTLWASMARAGMRAIARNPPLRLRLQIAGKTVRVHAAALTITPNAIAETGRMFRRPHLDAGELAIYLVQTLTLGRFARFVLLLLLGRWRRDPALQETRAQSLEITSGRAAMRVMNDGEVILLAPPLRYRIRPAAVNVIAPSNTP